MWFSSGTPVSSTNKTDRHDIAGLLLKVVLNTIHIIPNLKLLNVVSSESCMLHTHLVFGYCYI
jgi:hypothetical protein